MRLLTILLAFACTFGGWVSCLQKPRSFAGIGGPQRIPARLGVDCRHCLQAGLIEMVPKSSRNGLASALATVVVKFALQPFDTVKTWQQMDRSGKGLQQTAMELIKRRGILGLWSGAGLTVIGSAPPVAVYFGIFNAVKVRLSAALPDKYRPVAVAVAAAVGNAAAACLRSPYEVLKSRLQMGRHPDILSALTYSMRTEGVLGLFGGGKLASQIIRDVPYAVITGVCYELLQGMLSRRRQQQQNTKGRTEADSRRSFSQDALCGGIAGGISSLLTTPLDVVKTRLMSGGTEFRYASVGDAVVRIAREEGAGAFFRGTTSRLLHKIPANGLFFLFYEAFRAALGAQEHYK